MRGGGGGGKETGVLFYPDFNPPPQKKSTYKDALSGNDIRPTNLERGRHLVKKMASVQAGTDGAHRADAHLFFVPRLSLVAAVPQISGICLLLMGKQSSSGRAVESSCYQASRRRRRFDPGEGKERKGRPPGLACKLLRRPDYRAGSFTGYLTRSPAQGEKDGPKSHLFLEQRRGFLQTRAAGPD